VVCKLLVTAGRRTSSQPGSRHPRLDVSGSVEPEFDHRELVAVDYHRERAGLEGRFGSRNEWGFSPKEGLSARLLRGFEQPFFGLFLALDAMTGPGHRFQTLGVDFFAARNALSKASFADARQSAIDHVEQLTVVVALAKQEFLVVRTGCAVSDVLSGLIVGCTTVLLIPDNHGTQFVAPGFQPFSERL